MNLKGIHGVVVAGLTMGALASAPLALAQPLAGWGPFKFGQTIAAAAKAAGPTSREFGSAVELDVKIEGNQYVAGALALGPSGRVVNNILLNPKAAETITDLSTCDALFEPMTTMVAKKYGKSKMPIEQVQTAAETGRGQVFHLTGGATISVAVSFTPNPSFGSPSCSAYIEMTPAKDPDAPKDLEF